MWRIPESETTLRNQIISHIIASAERNPTYLEFRYLENHLFIDLNQIDRDRSILAFRQAILSGKIKPEGDINNALISDLWLHYSTDEILKFVTTGSTLLVSARGSNAIAITKCSQ